MEDDNDGATCDRHDISFAAAARRTNKSPGIRLDYLMYRNNTGTSTVILIMLHIYCVKHECDMK